MRLLKYSGAYTSPEIIVIDILITVSFVYEGFHMHIVYGIRFPIPAPCHVQKFRN